MSGIRDGRGSFLKNTAMALYSNLPVYKATYDLLIEFYRREDTIPRKYRYSIVDEIKRYLCDLLSMVYQANASQDKKPFLRLAMRDIEEVKIRVRILSDLHVLGVRHFADLCVREESISKQLTAWHNSVR